MRRNDLRIVKSELRNANSESGKPATSLFVMIVIIAFTVSTCQQQDEKVEQVVIARIAMMPNQPEPYKMTDWFEKAQHFDQYVFNLDLKGDHMPLIWIDNSQRNIPQNT